MNSNSLRSIFTAAIVSVLVGVLLVALGACAAGPNYVPPRIPAAATTAFIGTASPAVSNAPPDDHWWRLYHDPVLDQLIQDALAANTDMRVAVAHLERARATLHGSEADRLPQTGLSASGTYGRLPISEVLPGEDRQGWTVDAGLNVSYEADLFGRVRRNVEAARADADAAAADADAVRVMVVADTVRAYADASALAERLAVENRIVELLDDSVRVTTRRFEVGRGTKLDVIRIQTVRDQRAAEIPALTAERDAALFRLATLTGRTPQDLPANAAERSTTPGLDIPIPVGDGRALIARRPDVRAAERKLAADTARIGVATSDLYPHIVLGGSVGSTDAGITDFFGGGPFRWLAGPMISWNFPNQKVTRAKIAAANADTQASLASFDGAVLRSLQETETALSAYARELQRRDVLRTARDEAAAAARISRARQREGEIDFLSVLDAERTFAESESSLAASDARVASAQIDLFRALGGGWQND